MKTGTKRTTEREGPIPTDDRELTTRVTRDGDERAFRALYDRHTPRLLERDGDCVRTAFPILDTDETRALRAATASAAGALADAIEDDARTGPARCGP